MNSIGKARKTIWNALENDPSLKMTYVANIAMTMYDELHSKGYRPKLKPDDRNSIAEKLLRLIFKN
jgi:hypothetical protein